MVEFNDDGAPKPPEKKFLSTMKISSSADSLKTMPEKPQLPRKQGHCCFDSCVQYPRQDSIYSALKPSLRVTLALPPDFVVKAAVRGGLLGLQGGRVLRIDWRERAGCLELQGAGNRNVSGLTMDATGRVLIQHASGQIFGLEPTDALVPLFKASNGTLIARPARPQVFLVSGQETLVIEEGAVKQRIPSHFASFQFVSADEIAVSRGASQVDLYALSASLQPVSLGHLELAIEAGQLLKCVKIGDVYVTVQVEGKLTLWNLKTRSRTLVPLTVHRISAVAVDADGRLWIGLQSGQLMVVAVVVEGKVEVLAEFRAHEASIMRIYEQEDTVVSIDTAGHVCIWDRLLQKYHLSKSFERDN